MLINLGKNQGHKSGYNFFLGAGTFLIFHVVIPKGQADLMRWVTWVWGQGVRVGGSLPKKLPKPTPFRVLSRMNSNFVRWYPDVSSTKLFFLFFEIRSLKKNIDNFIIQMEKNGLFSRFFDFKSTPTKYKDEIQKTKKKVLWARWMATRTQNFRLFRWKT